MLIDTSIWVEHLSHNQLGLVSLLHREDVHCHPFIIGELACGSIIRRVEILQLLRRLPSVPVVENEEVARSADLAYEIGTFELTLADQTGKSAASRGKYVVAWKKQTNGQWKAAADIFNTDQ